MRDSAGPTYGARDNHISQLDEGRMTRTLFHEISILALVSYLVVALPNHPEPGTEPEGNAILTPTPPSSCIL
jgi:hypothetical protein